MALTVMNNRRPVDPGLSIIVSARNEGPSIGEVISKSTNYSNDVIVVDGHSADDTQTISKSLGARVYKDNKKGKGDAMRVGLSHANNEIIVFIDADGSHDPDDIPRLLQPIQDQSADMVIGSRPRGGSDELHGDLNKFMRMIGSDIITLGINYRYGVRLTDSQNGFRAVKRDVALSLGLNENSTTIEQEMLMKALRRGYRVFEVPTHEYARKHGVSTIKLSRVWFRYIYSWVKGLLF